MNFAQDVVKNIIIKHRYCTKSRRPFYELAKKYLPKDKNAIILDIGSGFPIFGENIKHKNIYFLDKNKVNHKNYIHYIAPGKLPFKKKSVQFIHCSHLIEHLSTSTKKTYKLLKEIDRVLTNKGILVISAPLLTENFYGEPTHKRPYAPQGIAKYLCKRKNKTADYTMGNISDNYIIKNLTYRYTSKADYDNCGLGSKYLLIDLLITILKKMLNKLGFVNYIKSGYTLILKKLKKPQ